MKFLHKYRIAKERLENDFGLTVIPMPHALKGSAFVANHPELRAKDLMDAFEAPPFVQSFVPSAEMIPFALYLT